MKYTSEFTFRGAAEFGKEHLLAQMDGSPREGYQPGKTMGFDVEMLIRDLPTVFRALEPIPNPDQQKPLTDINPLVPRAFDIRKLPPRGMWTPLLRGDGCVINGFTLVHPPHRSSTVLRDADADHLWYVYEGHGVCYTDFGNFEYAAGDFIYVPKGALVWFVNLSDTRMIGMESAGGWRKRARSPYENVMVPYNEFAARVPVPKWFTGIYDPCEVLVKRGGQWTRFEYAIAPFLCVAWMGTQYPFAIHSSKLNLPYVDSIHPDPSNFGAFASPDGSNMLSVLGPRRVHSLPYHHHNPLTEVLFYAKKYDARKGSKGAVGDAGTATVHPMGVWHGPQMGAVEEWKRPESAKDLPWVEDLAIMFETASVLTPTQELLEILIGGYERSWLESWEEYQNRAKAHKGHSMSFTQI